jgi:ABC-2 type transport system permease protein
LNPMAQIVQDARYVSITKQTITPHQVFHGGWYQIIPFIVVAVVFIIGISYFKKESKYFAENI